MSGKITEHFAEHFRLVICLVAFVNEIGVHLTLFKGYFFDAEASGESPETGNTKKFGRDCRNCSETVDKTSLECLKIEFTFDSVEFLIE